MPSSDSVVLHLLLDRQSLYKQQRSSCLLEKECLGGGLLVSNTSNSMDCGCEKRETEVEESVYGWNLNGVENTMTPLLKLLQ